MSKTPFRVALLASAIISACGPKAAPVVDQKPAQILYEQKMRWILQLEDERQLRGGGGDLIALLTDAEARIRRRAALGVGRVKLAEGVAPLTPLLHTDPDADVDRGTAELVHEYVSNQ